MCKYSMRKTFFAVVVLTQLVAEGAGLLFNLCSNHHFYVEAKSGRFTSLKFRDELVTDCADYGNLSVIKYLFYITFPCVTKVDEDGMDSVMKLCPKVERKHLITLEILTILTNLPTVTAPGTYWCGSGNISSSDDDLGFFSETDKCCRAHDHCNDTIPASDTKHGIKNTRPFKILHCACDEHQYECLSNVKKPVADAIGVIYFNTLANPCFKEDYPILRCVKNGGLLGNQCQQYELNMSAEPIYQFFDAKMYYPTTLN